MALGLIFFKIYQKNNIFAIFLLISQLCRGLKMLSSFFFSLISYHDAPETSFNGDTQCLAIICNNRNPNPLWIRFGEWNILMRNVKLKMRLMKLYIVTQFLLFLDVIRFICNCVQIFSHVLSCPKGSLQALQHVSGCVPDIQLDLLFGWSNIEFFKFQYNLNFAYIMRLRGKLDQNSTIS